MRFVKIEFQTQGEPDKAYLGMAQRGRVICLPNDRFIAAEMALDWHETQGLKPVILERLNQDGVIQTYRNSLVHPV